MTTQIPSAEDQTRDDTGVIVLRAHIPLDGDGTGPEAIYEDFTGELTDELADAWADALADICEALMRELGIGVELLAPRPDSMTSSTPMSSTPMSSTPMVRSQAHDQSANYSRPE